MGDLLKGVYMFLHPHYIFNILLSVIFFLLKTIEPICSMMFDDCQLELREWELLTFMGCIIVMKNRKQPSYAMYIETACMFSKLLSTFLFMRQNPVFGLLYILACLFHLVFFPRPVYTGPDLVTYFRGPNLENEVERDKRITWVIEFFAAWAPTCVSFGHDFAELSAKYTLDNLKFGKIDVTRYPDIAKKFEISTSSWSKQLPTVILFQNGKETRRRPAIDSKGNIVAKFIFCKENVERDFQLTELHLQCRNNPLSKHKERKNIAEKEDAPTADGDKKTN